MFERTCRVTAALVALTLSLSLDATEVVLRDGSSYTGLEVVEYDGEREFFQIRKGERQILIRAADVSTIDLEGIPGWVTVREGDTYPNLEILQFDLPRNRLTLSKSGKVLNLPLRDIARVSFTTDRVERTETKNHPTEAMTVSSATEEQETEDKWKEEGLYSNLPEDFGKDKFSPAGDKTQETGYTPRWKTDNGASSKTKKKEVSREGKSSKTKPTVKDRSSRENRRIERSQERRAKRSSRDTRGRTRRSLLREDNGTLTNETNFR